MAYSCDYWYFPSQSIVPLKTLEEPIPYLKRLKRCILLQKQYLQWSPFCLPWKQRRCISVFLHAHQYGIMILGLNYRGANYRSHIQIIWSWMSPSRCGKNTALLSCFFFFKYPVWRFGIFLRERQLGRSCCVCYWGQDMNYSGKVHFIW